MTAVALPVVVDERLWGALFRFDDGAGCGGR
jgi:hypothetical protein